jgi:hypothetical protein
MPYGAAMVYVDADAAPEQRGDGALSPHFGLLESGGSNRAVESGAQLIGPLQRQLNPG